MTHRKQTTYRLIAGASVVAATLLATGCSPSASAESTEFTILIAHEDPSDHYYHESFEFFKEIVEEESDGRISVNVVPNELFGTADAVTTAVQLNSIQMTAPTAGVLGQFSDLQNTWDMPFLFDDTSHAHRVLDGEFGQELLDNLEEVALIGLGYWENGSRHLTTSGVEVTSPDDLDRVKIRVQPNALQLVAWNATSANPTPMAFGEVYTGLQQGTIDAQENPLSLIVSQRFYEVQDRVTLTGHVYSTSPLIMSKIFFDSLPEDLQRIVLDAATESVTFNRERAAEVEQESQTIIADAGVELVEISDEGRDAFRETMQDAAFPYLKRLIGDEYVERLETAIEEERQ